MGGVDQDGEVIDVFLQRRRDGRAAKRFFKRLLRKHQGEPRKIVTDKLRSYGVAHRELMPDTIHDTSLYANNRAELSHESTRVRERGMRKFKSMEQAQRFLNAHAAVYNLVALVGIWCQQRTIGISECARLRLGKRRWCYRRCTEVFFNGSCG